ncbi:fungal-specific transcription factor domain-containing protein [Exophiala viscosa]|uniref:fungal-specific transcription factor domain-containing protein n=1 Tax=Exophiala viscosa TaxID=2486360 RepID=UPI00219B3A2E|nr:fungal-specific transcription factor domain-containing protein [Exophiala viscosa]
MDAEVKPEGSRSQSSAGQEFSENTEALTQTPSKGKNKNKDKESSASTKRRCVSTACIACRKRKSKCDGMLPKCAACASVYLTECEYAPHTDHRRKGVYKKDVDSSKTKNSTLQVLIQAILNAEEDDVLDLVRQIRTCDSLEELAGSIEAGERYGDDRADSPVYNDDMMVPQFEAELSGKMGDLMLDGSVKFIGGTSNLIWLPHDYEHGGTGISPPEKTVVRPKEEAILSWTKVTQNKDDILHFMNMYFCWHYAFFTTLAKELFYRDFLTGQTSQYCSPLLVNVMLALGCHFSSRPAARADPDDSGTTGDHFFAEAKRLLYDNDEFANAKLCTVQALALMSVREAGCGHESKGWVYSGMSFRMAGDLGLNVDAQPMNESSRLTDEDVDARRVTFWGCFLFDKCWSNYLGRQPQLQLPNITVKRPDVFPSEDSEMWSPYTDSGIIQAHAQPARTRAVALQLSKLAEISSDLLISFYNPQQLDKPLSKQAELKKLTDLHTRLEAWKQGLPTEMEPKEGQLPQVLLMHMFFQLLYIHLYRPFLKYTRTTSPLPSHVSPRKYCTQAAGAVSKLFRLYKRTHGLRQICNIAIYIVHSACTIHLLNLPDKNARRDIVHGIKHLEEMGECWTAARRTLRVLRICADRWNIDIPEEAEMVYTRIKVKWGVTAEAGSPVSPLTMGHMAKHIQAQPVPDLMARNIQQQQRHGMMMIPQTQGGMSVPMAPSPPETIDTRRSSGNLSMPPQSAADLSRDAHRVRSSTYLTKAQHDAWNAHQARLATTSTAASGTQMSSANAAKLFGGVDSLIEDTQDWFFKDQNQLAMGFGNWVEPQQDWGTLDLSFFGTDGSGTVNNGSYVNTNDSSPAYNGGSMQQYTSYDTSPPYVYGGQVGTSMANGNGNGNIGSNSTFTNGNGAGVKPNRRGMGGMGMNPGLDLKRRQSQQAQNGAFDDDMYY